jgi:hypothetical protein
VGKSFVPLLCCRIVAVAYQVGLPNSQRKAADRFYSNNYHR